MTAPLFFSIPLSEKDMQRMIVRSNSDDSHAAVRRQVRRDLFGPIDHEEAQSFVDREISAMKKRDKEKWSFDFENETPIENSKYCWEPITPANFFGAWLVQRDAEPTKDPSTTSTTSVTQDQATNKLNSPSAKQSHITDFLKCRRKRSLSLDDASRRKMSPEDAALLRTKRTRTRQRQL